jgi:hypothetical protein
VRNFGEGAVLKVNLESKETVNSQDVPAEPDTNNSIELDYDAVNAAFHFINQATDPVKGSLKLTVLCLVTLHPYVSGWLAPQFI